MYTKDTAMYEIKTAEELLRYVLDYETKYSLNEIQATYLMQINEEENIFIKYIETKKENKNEVMLISHFSEVERYQICNFDDFICQTIEFNHIRLQQINEQIKEVKDIPTYNQLIENKNIYEKREKELSLLYQQTEYYNFFNGTKRMVVT